jgi:hypothetical protein
MATLENFGQQEDQAIVIASLKLLKDIEYLENNWIKEKGQTGQPELTVRSSTALQWPGRSIEFPHTRKCRASVTPTFYKNKILCK